MTTAAEYLALITSEHSQKPKFNATLSAALDPLASLQGVLTNFKTYFDLDTAIGIQLDTIGIWVGVTRQVTIPLVDVYFSWDVSINTGWDSGSWQGQFDPTNGLVTLPDDDYRILLRAKIVQNNWDGSIPGAYSVWETVFGTSTIILIQDNQDMSMTIGIVGAPLSAISKALLTGGLIQPKPAGVRINYYAIGPDAGPLFAWDATSTALAGWETGSWAQELQPS